jgi:hypothetical protein
MSEGPTWDNAISHRCRTRFLDWLRELPILARLWLLDRSTGPYPETEADRIRQQRKERLRRAFPDVDVDGTGPGSG